MGKRQSLIKKFLNDYILNSELNYMGRASDMLDLAFTKDSKEYMLHIQSAWRLTYKNKILVGSMDLFEPPTYFKEAIGDFNWDEDSYFLEYAKNFNDLKQKMKVTSIKVSKFGDFTLLFENNQKLEVFHSISNNANESEEWRLFLFDETSPHFVVYNNGIYYNKHWLQK